MARAPPDRKLTASLSQWVATRRKSLRRQKASSTRWRAGVAILVASDGAFAVTPAQDDGNGTGLLQRAPERVGIVALVGEQVSDAPSASEKGWRSLDFADVARRQHQRIDGAAGRPSTRRSRRCSDCDVRRGAHGVHDALFHALRLFARPGLHRLRQSRTSAMVCLTGAWPRRGSRGYASLASIDATRRSTTTRPPSTRSLFEPSIADDLRQRMSPAASTTGRSPCSLRCHHDRRGASGSPSPKSGTWADGERQLSDRCRGRDPLAYVQPVRRRLSLLLVAMNS